MILLGPPASGKTTVAFQLASGHGQIAVIKTGHLLRREVEANSPRGRRLRPFLEEGRLAPTHLVVEVVTEAVRRASANIVLFDGFPRRENQIQPFLRMCVETGLTLRAVVVLMLTAEEVKRRISGRRVCPRCGATYNVIADPPTSEGRCDKCGEKLVQRKDDSPEAAEERLRTFAEETHPVIAHFRSHEPDRTHEVQADAPVPQVVQAIRRALDGTETADRSPAAEMASPEEIANTALGAVVGGLLAGPVGAVLGAATGALIEDAPEKRQPAKASPSKQARNTSRRRTGNRTRRRKQPKHDR